MQKIVFLILIQALLSNLGWAQDSALISLPMASYGIHDIHQRELKPFQAYITKQIEQRWPNLKPLLDHQNAANIPTTTSQRSLLRAMLSTTALTPEKPPQSVDIIRPSLCRFEEGAVLILQNIQIREQQVRSRYQHRYIANLFSKSHHINPVWQSLETAANELMMNLPSENPAPATIMKLSFFNRRPLLGKPKTDAVCLNMLLAEQLQDIGHIQPEEGSFELQIIYDLLKIQQPSKRHNRILSLDWQLADAGWKLPKPISIKSRFVESVISGLSTKETQTNSEATLTLNESKNQIVISGIDPIVEKTTLLAKQLPLQEDPRVIGVYGAWAYLHLGRAYGLTMNTRMVSREDPDIQGHVVAFFGPDSGLKDIDGNTIQEGAILFIRKGQQKIRNGIPFVFDERQYPQQANSRDDRNSKKEEGSP